MTLLCGGRYWHAVIACFVLVSTADAHFRGARLVRPVESSSVLPDQEIVVVPEVYPLKQKIHHGRNISHAGAKALDEGATAATLTGVKGNRHGDLRNTVVVLSINCCMVLICALIFGKLRLQYPTVYSGNLGVHDPAQPSETYWGWVSASRSMSIAMAAERVGLDAAMLLEFCNVCIRILTIIGVPMVCIMCPLHWMYGGNGMIYELSSVAMGNVAMQHPWLYYVHAIVVSLVTFTVIHVVYDAMNRFLELRLTWLKNLPAPRCTTVLVEGIPEQWRSDGKLKEFFVHLFGADSVKEAVMVKLAPELQRIHQEQRAVRQHLKEANQEWRQSKKEAEDARKASKQEQQAIASGEATIQSVEDNQELRPTIQTPRRLLTGEPGVDAITYYEEKLKDLEKEVKEARESAIDEASTVGGINMSAGFVTFDNRRHALACLNTVYAKNSDEFVVSLPPPSSDVLWNNLKQDEGGIIISTFLAYACATMVFFVFLPAVLLGTNITELIHAGPLQHIWESFAPSLSLMLFLGFLPTVFLMIFRTFLTLKADIFAQHKLQEWYFIFMFFFIILVTAIGQSLFSTFQKVVRKPELGLALMANNMPNATHFYMNFLMLQWGEQAVCVLRHMNLFKFLMFRRFHDDLTAKELSEPEDQDYYGLGARSARFSINMLIGIIFSTLSPLIAILTLILFHLCRLFYGYLLVFGEVRKADLGGVFFVTQLQHLLFGVGVYNLLMIGVLHGRAPTFFPAILAIPSLIYTLHCYRHFEKHFIWTNLPFEEFIFHGAQMRHFDNGTRYVQDEFIDSPERAKMARARWRTEKDHVHNERMMSRCLH